MDETAFEFGRWSVTPILAHVGAHSVSLLLVHVVWATRRRERVIKAIHDDALERQLRKIAIGMDATLHACGVADDHVHVLLQMPPELSVATLVNRLKGASSHALRHALGIGWQAGYWAESVSGDAVEATARYIRAQRQHHAKPSCDEPWERA
jgi:REP element-mobilizing transposase RayT